MKKILIAVGALASPFVANAQLSAPNIDTLSTNATTVLAGVTTGVNWAIGAFFVLGGVLAALAVIGAVVLRVRGRSVK